MSKKLLVAIFLSCIIISIFITKFEKRMSHENSLRVHEYALNYLSDRNYTVDSFSPIKDEEVVLFSSDDKFGIGSFYINDENDIIESISIVDKPINKVGYTQIEGKNRCFITMLLNDENLKTSAFKIQITYEGEIPQSTIIFEEAVTYGDAEMASYVGDIRVIKLIQYFDKSKKEVSRSSSK